MKLRHRIFWPQVPQETYISELPLHAGQHIYIFFSDCRNYMFVAYTCVPCKTKFHESRKHICLVFLEGQYGACKRKPINFCRVKDIIKLYPNWDSFYTWRPYHSWRTNHSLKLLELVYQRNAVLHYLSPAPSFSVFLRTGDSLPSLCGCMKYCLPQDRVSVRLKIHSTCFI